MKSFINHSNSPALRFESLDLKGNYFYTVVARSTYDLIIHDDEPNAELNFSENQSDLCYTDVTHHAMAGGYVKFESDLAPCKPALDIVLNATAYAPMNEPHDSFIASLSVNTKSIHLRVFGPRFWKRKLSRWFLSEPQPTCSVGLTYDKAFGGCYEIDGQHFISSYNPAGCGWYPYSYLKKIKEDFLPAPQIEFLDKPVVSISQEMEAAGFGFYGKGWKGRIELAGTWDDRWKNEKFPALPDDFNFSYWNGAHPCMQYELPKPGTSLTFKLNNLRPMHSQNESEIQFVIPYEFFFIANHYSNDLINTKDCYMDTIVIDLNENKIYVTYRIHFSKIKELTSTELFHLNSDECDFFCKRAMFLSQLKEADEFILLPPSLKMKIAEGYYG